MNKRRIDWDEEDIKRNFSLHDGEFDGYEVVFSKDTSAPYETSFWALLRKGGQLYRIDCGTCSCYGCEGQFHPEPTTLEAVKDDMDNSEWSSVYDFLL